MLPPSLISMKGQDIEVTLLNNNQQKYISGFHVPQKRKIKLSNLNEYRVNSSMDTKKSNNHVSREQQYRIMNTSSQLFNETSNQIMKSANVDNKNLQQILKRMVNSNSMVQPNLIIQLKNETVDAQMNKKKKLEIYDLSQKQIDQLGRKYEIMKDINSQGNLKKKKKLILDELNEQIKNSDVSYKISECFRGRTNYSFDVDNVLLFERLAYFQILENSGDTFLKDFIQLIHKSFTLLSNVIIKENLNSSFTQMKNLESLEMNQLFQIGEMVLLSTDEARSQFKSSVEVIRQAYKSVISKQDVGFLAFSLQKLQPTSNAQFSTQMVKFRELFSFWLTEFTEPHFLHLIPQYYHNPPTPYIQNLPPNALVLVIDLDETLVHYRRSQQNTLLIRNYATEFLENLSQEYTVVVWTASLSRYARWALKKISTKFRPLLLTRHHCIKNQLYYMKELKRLCSGALYRCIIIENEIQNISLDEKHNCIVVESFVDYQVRDQTLKGIHDVLVGVAKGYKEGDDIRNSIQNILNQ